MKELQRLKELYPFTALDGIKLISHRLESTELGQLKKRVVKKTGKGPRYTVRQDREGWEELIRYLRETARVHADWTKIGSIRMHRYKTYYEFQVAFNDALMKYGGEQYVDSEKNLQMGTPVIEAFY